MKQRSILFFLHSCTPLHTRTLLPKHTLSRSRARSFGEWSRDSDHRDSNDRRVDVARAADGNSAGSRRHSSPTGSHGKSSYRRRICRRRSPVFVDGDIERTTFTQRRFHGNYRRRQSPGIHRPALIPLIHSQCQVRFFFLLELRWERDLYDVVEKVFAFPLVSMISHPFRN